MAITVKNLDTLLGIQVINECNEIGVVVAINIGSSHPIRVEYSHCYGNYTKDGTLYDGEISLHTTSSVALQQLMELYELSADDLILLILEEHC